MIVNYVTVNNFSGCNRTIIKIMSCSHFVPVAAKLKDS